MSLGIPSKIAGVAKFQIVPYVVPGGKATREAGKYRNINRVESFLSPLISFHQKNPGRFFGAVGSGGKMKKARIDAGLSNPSAP
jgi:hypothetical protein